MFSNCSEGLKIYTLVIKLYWRSYYFLAKHSVQSVKVGQPLDSVLVKIATYKTSYLFNI